MFYIKQSRGGWSMTAPYGYETREHAERIAEEMRNIHKDWGGQYAEVIVEVVDKLD